MYGNFDLSSKEGRRDEDPRTESSSACARFCTSGYNVIASMKEANDEGVYQNHQLPGNTKTGGITVSAPPIRLPPSAYRGAQVFKSSLPYLNIGMQLLP